MLKNIKYLIFILLFSLNAISMENTEFVSKEEKVIALNSFVTPKEIVDKLIEYKSIIDFNYSSNTWKILLEIFLLGKFHETNPEAEIDKNKFIVTLSSNELPISEVNDALELLKWLKISKVIFDHLLYSYAKFSNGDSCEIIINRLSIEDKTVLDKYFFLLFDKHLALPEKLLSSVSLKEFLEYKKIPVSCCKDIPKFLFLNFRNCSLNNLEDWGLALQGNQIIPEAIKILNLSKNKLKVLDPKVFEGCKNLTNLNLADNLLEDLPEDCFKDCLALVELDLSKNLISQMQEKLLEPCAKLKILILTGNKIKELPYVIFLSPDLKKIYLDNGVKISTDMISKEIIEKAEFDGDYNFKHISRALAIPVSLILKFNWFYDYFF